MFSLSPEASPNVSGQALHQGEESFMRAKGVGSGVGWKGELLLGKTIMSEVCGRISIFVCVFQPLGGDVC